EYFIWGVVGAVAVQLRSAYTLMIALSGVSMAVIFSRDLIRHARATGNFRTIFGLAAGHAWRLLLFAVGILLVEVPQVIIFREAGFHWKLFPFDSQNGLFLRSALGNILLVNLYPYTVVDQLGLKLVQVHFGLPSSLDGFAVLDAVRLKNFGDLMELWRQHPVFFLWHYPKRFFDGLDVRFSNPYPIHRGDLRYLEVFAVMFTNYTMLFVGAWSAFNSWRKKIFSRHEVMFLALIFVFVAVQVLLHVEWRYFIPGHFIFYYLLVFHAPHLWRRFTKTQVAAVLISYLAFLLLCIILGTDVTLKLREMEPFRYVLGCW
ncbi:MAG: hypothetical protein HGA76_11820, partial [Candidatus Firestonebacteria bacterium]|nr:hypothetical protein [Candidatus Firestonebacteria bacterium]